MSNSSCLQPRFTRLNPPSRRQAIEVETVSSSSNAAAVNPGYRAQARSQRAPFCLRF